MRIIRSLALVLLLATVVGSALAADEDQMPWSQRAANAAMARWPLGNIDGPGAKPAFKYELGVLLEGIDDVYLNTADVRYFNYIKSAVDELVTPAGAIPTYKPEEHDLGSILMGRQLLRFYGVTQDKLYLTAATQLYDQLQTQPRTPLGGFWNKQRYPNQIWLDDLYMAEPFYAEYASVAHHPEKFADITHQFLLVTEHMRDAKTGLLYHGWDESKEKRWAKNKTGDSPEFWGRAMGSYMMALVDTLDYFPADDPGRKQLIAILAEEAAALTRVQDAQTGFWYEVLDKGGAKGDYVESSASCMIVYALAKGVRRGYLPSRYGVNAERGYQGILATLVRKGPGDDVSATGTVNEGGLGGDPNRDGSYAYYLGEKVVANGPMGVGPFIMAAAEMENAQNAKIGRGDTVLVDGWFNSQRRTDAFGKEVYFHYKWDTQDDPGYSLFGHIFRNFGAETKEPDGEPTLENLRTAQVYVIASPDNLNKNPHPNYATAEDAAQIASWVKAGGVLAIFENDTSFADLDHFNVIAEKFGMHFNSVLRKHVIGTNWEQGKIELDGSGPIFHHPHTVFVKDVCTLSVEVAAVTVLKEGDDIFMATAKYGKGTVFAFVDPWLYNEYTDGRKLPADYDNYAAGVELVRWILQQVPR
ncbi:MAG: glycoside hydrolase family 88 protein [Terracidiphilus sp.]